MLFTFKRLALHPHKVWYKSLFKKKHSCTESKTAIIGKSKNCTIAQKYFTLKVEENVPDIKLLLIS